MKARISAYKNRIIASAKDIKHRLSSSRLPTAFTRKDVPYFCQWESPELAKDILEHKIQASDDPKWKDSGAKLKEEYTSWTWSGCGMACTKMVIAHALHKTIPLVELGKQCLSYGGYKLPLEDHPGLYYGPFCTFLKNEYGLSARAVSGLATSNIIEAIGNGGYAIVSVTPEIRYPEKTPQHKSGHLVLIVGYDTAKQILYLHNPSGTEERNQEYAEVTFNQFKRFFSYRGISIHKERTL